jgi:intein-encoded DNA endonuclease-like protein
MDFIASIFQSSGSSSDMSTTRMTLAENATNIIGRGTPNDSVVLPIRNEVRSGNYLPFDSRVRLHVRVMELAKLSMSYQQIQNEIFDSTHIWLSKGSISGWVRGIHNPSGGKNAFHAVPSPELAYVIGVIAGDGNLNVHGYNYVMLLSVTDRDFAEEFSRCLAKTLSRRKPYRVRRSDKRNRWIVQGSSLLLYRFLNRPWQKLKTYIEHCEECTAAFLRAFYDGEGSISQGHLVISNTDKMLLNYVRDLLHVLKIETGKLLVSTKAGTILKDPRTGKIYRRRHDCYQLVIRTKSRAQFARHVGFTIQRKQLLLRAATS